MLVMAQQMSPLVPHCLTNEMVRVFIEKLTIQTNMVFSQKGLTGRLPAQVKTNGGQRHRTTMAGMAFHDPFQHALLEQRLHWCAACSTETNNLR